MNPGGPLRRCYFQRLLFLLLLLSTPFSNCVAEVDLKVEIQGVKDELLDNVRAYLSLERRKSEDNLTERWVALLHEDAPEEIRAALEPFGYYNVEISDSLVEQEGKWTARYDIVPGNQVLISAVDLCFLGQGADEAKLKEALNDFPLKIGDALDHQQYEKGRDALLDAANRIGYVKATASVAQVLVTPQSESAEVTLHIDTGPLYYFGEIRIHQDFLDQELVEKFVTLEPGEPYINRDVLTFQQGLQVTDWASVVRVEPDFEEAIDYRVPLNVTMQPSKRHRYAFGIGYETDVGIRLSANWIYRRINKAGHSSEASLRLSPVRRTLRGTYYIPVREPLTDRLAASAQYEYEETSDTRRDTFEGEMAFIRQSLNGRNFRKAFLELRREEFEIRDDDPTLTSLFSIGVVRRYTELGQGPFPQTGRHFSVDLRGASSSFLSDTSYLRLYLAGKYLLPVGVNGRFKVRGELGTSEVEFFDSYPTSLRFFAGGDYSVRGYEYKSLGPQDENGNVVGGKHLLTFSGEYEHRVAEQWALAGFVDAGNAYNDELDELYIGGGVGFRWLSNFGSLRVDFAWPISENDVEFTDGQILLGFGMAL